MAVKAKLVVAYSYFCSQCGDEICWEGCAVCDKTIPFQQGTEIYCENNQKDYSEHFCSMECAKKFLENKMNIEKNY